MNAPQNTTTRKPRVVQFMKKYPTRSTSQNFQRTQSNPQDAPKGTFCPLNNNANKGARTNNARSNNPNTKGGPSRTTQNKTTSKDVECYNCGEKGHYSTNCPKRPRVFAAQVIDEDAESSPIVDRDGDNQDADRDNDKGEQSPEIEGEPIGSQCELEQEGYPLDKYDEYIEVFGFDANDGDVVYICAGQITNNDIIINDTRQTDIIDEDHTSDISDGAPTLVDSVKTSVELRDIPSDMYPNELLLALSDKVRIEIFYKWKREEN